MFSHLRALCGLIRSFKGTFFFFFFFLPGEEAMGLKVGSSDDKRWVVSASLWGSKPACTAEVLLGRRVRRDGLGSAAFTAGLLHLKGLFQPKMVL